MTRVASNLKRFSLTISEMLFSFTNITVPIFKDTCNGTGKKNTNKLKTKGNEVIDFRGCYTIMSQGTDLK